jgi:diguanylate cyclase (GGDEF)-like protein
MNYYRNSLTATSLFAGFASTILGLTKLLPWYLNTSLSHLDEYNFWYMHLSTAATLILIGIALSTLSLSKKKSFVVTILLTTIVILSSQTFTSNLSYFFHDPSNKSTVFILLLLSFTLFLLNKEKIKQPVFFIIILLNIIAFSVGCISFISFLLPHSQLVVPTKSIYLDFLTSYGIVMLSLGIISLTWLKATEIKDQLTNQLPLFIFASLSMTSILFWQAMLINENTSQEQMVKSAANDVFDELKYNLENRIKSINRMSDRWVMQLPNGTPYANWYQDALNYWRDQPGYAALGWVDSKSIVQWVAPLSTETRKAIHLNLLLEEKRKSAIEAATNTGQTVITQALTLKSGEEGFVIISPIIKNRKLYGFITAGINSTAYFKSSLDNSISPSYNIGIYDKNNKLLFQRGKPDQNLKYFSELKVDIHGIKLIIKTSPSLELITSQHTVLPFISLIVGLIISALLSLTAYFIQLSKKNMAEAKAEIKKRQEAETKLLNYNQMLEKISLIDNLTGLGNRYCLEKVLNHEIAQLKKTDNPCSVLLLDIDHFKKVNDQYGHITGDIILKNVADILVMNSRINDTALRFGGEEFLLVLPNTTQRSAIKIAERIRVAISKHQYQYDEKTILSITCSIGAYQLETDDLHINTLLEKVDSYLYQAKNTGRNRTVAPTSSVS